MKQLDGQDVVKVTRVPWQADDDETQLNIGVIVGRCTVDTNGGGRYYGLLFIVDTDLCIEHVDVDVGPRVRFTHQYAAVVWERSTKRFAVALLESGEIPGVLALGETVVPK